MFAGSTEAYPRDDWGPPPMITADEIRALLFDSWITDGRRGFFVDGAHSTTSPPFSLYDTLWQLRLGQYAGQDTAGLSPVSVQAWISGALDGRLDGSGLPAIAQVEYAVQTLDIVGAPVDQRRVARTLDRLRSGGRYRTNALAGEPDWGSTALAVRIQTQLGLPVAPEVVACAEQALNSYGVEPAAAPRLTQAISLLQIAGDLSTQVRRVVPEQAMAGLIRAVDQRLSSTRVDAVWLAQKAALHRAAAQLGIEVAPVGPGSRAHVTRSDGSVTLPGYAAPEPQATCYAIELGCRDVRIPSVPAHSRAGWPDYNAIARGVEVSAAAMRVAGEVRMDRLFVKPLQRQIREVWLPAMRQALPARSMSAHVNQVNLRILAALVGGPVAHDVDGVLPASGGRQGNDVVMLLDRDDLCAKDHCAETGSDSQGVNYLPMSTLAIMLAGQRRMYGNASPSPSEIARIGDSPAARRLGQVGYTTSPG
jgi:hypothetical protein